MATTKEKYFVASDGETPQQIFFQWEAAVENRAPYVDSFDEQGRRVNSYAFIDGRYVTDF